MLMPPRDIPSAAVELIDRVRTRRPRVHCITNAVAQTFTANMLLAAGAIPSMTISADEIAGFVASADALLVNLGTFDAGRRAAVALALEVAADRRLPWLLDPVFVDRSPPRAAFARELVAREPRAIRLNRAEFATLAGAEPDGAALTRFALDTLAVVAVTGAVDLVTDGARLASLGNGHPLMDRVTAMGCAGAALCTAFMAVEADAFVAVAAGLAVLGIAGEIAGASAAGPGSFVTAIVDALYALDGDTIRERAKVL